MPVEEVVLVEQPLAEIIEEIVQVERPWTQINEEDALLISSPPRDRAISPIVEPVFQTPPVTRSTPDSRFYQRFVVKASHPLIETPLNCSEHPFFGLVFNKERDIFDIFMFDYARMKELILNKIFESVQELEPFDILDVPEEVISKVARTVAAVEKMGIRSSGRTK